MQTSSSSAGVGCSVVSSGLFALLYYYFNFLPYMPGNELFGWRMVFSMAFMLLLLLSRPVRTSVVANVHAVRHSYSRLWVHLATSQLVGVQTWLFMWGPMNGYAMDISVGYLMLPLTLALTGKWVFKERFGCFKLCAFIIALAGFGWQLLAAKPMSWPVFVVCLGYPIYYTLRRKSGTDNQGGFLIDMALNLPAALIILGCSHELPVMTATSLGLLAGLGALSATALMLMIKASQYLDMILFGLMSYIEPILLVMVSILMGQYPSPDQYISYSCIGAAVALVMLEGTIILARRKRRYVTYRK